MTGKTAQTSKTDKTPIDSGRSRPAASASITVRMPAGRRAAIEAIARRQRRDLSSVINEMLEEALRMRRIPGIVFTDDSLGGRAARVEGTGLEVWEIIGGYLNLDGSWERLREAFDWLADQQLRAALAYYEAFPDEIDEAVAENASWTPERLRAEFPALAPRH